MNKPLLLLSLLVLIAGCGDKADRVDSTTQPPTLTTAAPTKVDADVQQPADARLTILCQYYKGASHVEQAKVIKQQMVAATGDKNFFVIHEEGVSGLYYGYYRFASPREFANMSKADMKEGARAQSDLARMKSMKDRFGSPLFPMAMQTSLEPVDPPAPPEWNLQNVNRGKADGDPSRGFWTLQVAIYKDTSTRKLDAVESVRLIREKLGLKDVFFYHGKTASSVCLGAWPRDAVREQDSDVVESANRDPDERLLVLAQRFPKGVSERFRDAEGKPVRAMAPKLEPVDPSMIDFMTRYDRLSVNGNDIEYTHRMRGGGLKKTYEPSQVVIIPQAGESGLLDRSDRNPDAMPDELLDRGAFPAPGRNPDSGGGQLRSIGR